MTAIIDGMISRGWAPMPCRFVGSTVDVSGVTPEVLLQALLIGLVKRKVED
jgi:hypothetical protein